jgi:hypothetical protein
VRIRLRQQSTHVCEDQSFTGSYALLHLDNACFLMPLGGQRPAPREHAPRQPVCKLLFFADRPHGLCLFLDGLDVPAKLMDMAGMDPGMHQAMRMGEFSGSGQCYIDVRYGLVRIAQYSEDPGKIGQAHDYKAVDTHMGCSFQGMPARHSSYRCVSRV